MISVGVDIIEIQRIEQAISNWQGSFLNRIYTPSELEQYFNITSSLAARFAGKEAVMKALGSNSIHTNWRDIEILSNREGAPTISLAGKTKEKAEEKGIRELSISLSHSKEYAIAFVVGYAN
jgi:holo-[acyl-carrier protein] synthase